MINGNFCVNDCSRDIIELILVLFKMSGFTKIIMQYLLQYMMFLLEHIYMKFALAINVGTRFL